jgi:hypothetical protein
LNAGGKQLPPVFYLPNTPRMLPDGIGPGAAGGDFDPLLFLLRVNRLDFPGGKRAVVDADIANHPLKKSDAGCGADCESGGGDRRA